VTLGLFAKISFEKVKNALQALLAINDKEVLGLPFAV